MIISDLCGSSTNSQERRRRYQSRKLEILNYIKDSLERRLAATNASISTLEKQMKSSDSSE